MLTISNQLTLRASSCTLYRAQLLRIAFLVTRVLMLARLAEIRPFGYYLSWESGTQIPYLDKEIQHHLKRKESARCAAKRHNSAFYLTDKNRTMVSVWSVRIYERKWLLVSADVRGEGKRDEALRTFAKSRVSSDMVVQKNRKIGNSGLRKWEKNREINGTFVDKDSLPVPRQGYNKGYESSASTFTNFRSTFKA